MIRTLLAMPLDVTMEAGEIARKVAKSSRKKRRRLQQDVRGTLLAHVKLICRAN